jgi:hypothetical protein
MVNYSLIERETGTRHLLNIKREYHVTHSKYWDFYKAPVDIPTIYDRLYKCNATPQTGEPF